MTKPDETEAYMRHQVARIIDSYVFCLDDPDYLDACVDDVLQAVLGWPVRYKTEEP